MNPVFTLQHAIEYLQDSDERTAALGEAMSLIGKCYGLLEDAHDAEREPLSPVAQKIINWKNTMSYPVK